MFTLQVLLNRKPVWKTFPRCLILEVKELAAKYGVRYLETSTELCHNIDELLVEMTSIVRTERQKLFRGHRRSSVRMVS